MLFHTITEIHVGKLDFSGLGKEESTLTVVYCECVEQHQALSHSDDVTGIEIYLKNSLYTNCVSQHLRTDVPGNYYEKYLQSAKSQ